MPPTCCGTAVTWAPDALPPALCARLRGLFGLESLPDTLAAAAEAVRPTADADAHPAVEEALAGETPPGTGHEVETETGRATAPAAADALALLALADEPGVVHSHDPVSGEPISLRLDEAGTDCDPPGTVVAFGAGPQVWSGERVTAELIRRSVVPFVHLFATRRTYWRWAAATEAPTVALTPADAHNVGRVLAGEPRSAVLPAEPFPVDGDERALVHESPRARRAARSGSGTDSWARLDDAVATPGRN